MLELSSVSVRYGPITAVDDVSLNLPRGQVGALLGANGAGKSSVLAAITGLVRPSAGRIDYEGTDLLRVKAFRRKGNGIACAMEGHRVFGNLTVYENLVLGALGPGKHRIDRSSLEAGVNREYERFPVLGERRQQRASLLSGGEQQMLTISSALMSEPKLLLLDEPSLGLSPKMQTLILDTIADLARGGLTILLIEQAVEQALAIADVAWVMRAGRIVRSGLPSSIGTTDEITALYLAPSSPASEQVTG